MHNLSGSCHCGNVQIEIGLPLAPKAYNPRACDCDFCTKHGAAYVSDPNGSLVIRIKSEQFLRKYRQGSGIAECLLCSNCGVLVAISYQSDGKTFATLNAKVLDSAVGFAQDQVVSPKKLSASEKTERWKKMWFSQVSLSYNAVSISE